jgi:small neutral amino acid transporter SnatA (MarC family)
MNESLSYLLTTLISLFAVIDPLGAIPVFLLLTPNKSPGERRRIALKAGAAVFLILSIGQTPQKNGCKNLILMAVGVQFVISGIARILR